MKISRLDSCVYLSVYMSVCLFVCVVADERPPLYFVQQPPRDVIGHVGGSVYINCSARSRDLGQVEVTWLKDGRDAVEGDARRSVTEAGALVIAPVMRKSSRRLVGSAGGSTAGDDGVYECVARYGTASIVSTPATLHIASNYFILSLLC